MSISLSLSFDGESIALSFVVGISVLIGIEIINVVYHHWRSGKPWSFCMRSLPMWAFLFELAPFGLWVTHENNAAILILGYALSLLFIILFYCSRLINQLNTERIATSNMKGLKTIEQERQERVSSVSIISPSARQVSINMPSDFERQSSNEVTSLSPRPKPKGLKNGVYWMLILNKQMDKKPVGYMSCNMHGFCYVNCKESKKSTFEITSSGNERGNFELHGFWKCSSDGTRTKRKICVKTQGHWSGYVCFYIAYHT